MSGYKRIKTPDLIRSTVLQRLVSISRVSPMRSAINGMHSWSIETPWRYSRSSPTQTHPVIAPGSTWRCASATWECCSAHTGGIGEALETYKKALAIRQELADAKPTVDEYQIALTESLENIGLLFNATGQKLNALESHKKALAIRQKLADANPTLTRYQNDLAQSLNMIGTASSTAADALGYFNIGNLLGATDEKADALESYKKALAIQQKARGREPG